MMREKNHHNMITQLRACRLKKGWTQQTLADHLGTTKMTIWRWETGQAYPNDLAIGQLCTLFACAQTDLGFSEKHQIYPTRSTIDPRLPDPPEPFIGREVVLTDLKVHLQMKKPKILAIHGQPGMGKTSLVTTLAHDAAVTSQFPDGILWANVGHYPDPHDLLKRWATHFHLPEQRTYPDLRMHLKQLLRNRAILIVLDDVWQVTDILPLLVGGEHCTYLLTTCLPEVARICTTATENVVCLKELGEQDSSYLLMHFLPLSALHEDQKRSLLRVCGGLPLALTLLGSYLRFQLRSNRPRRFQKALDTILNNAYPQGTYLVPHALPTKDMLGEICALLQKEQNAVGTTYPTIAPIEVEARRGY